MHVFKYLKNENLFVILYFIVSVSALPQFSQSSPIFNLFGNWKKRLNWVLCHIWCTYPFTDRHTFRLRSSNPALPYISRFLLFNLLTLPSTIPLVHLYLIAFQQPPNPF